MEQIRFGQGGLNTDDSVEIISPDDYPFAANVMSGRSQFSQNGAKELVRGTSVISTSTYLDSNSKFIGGVRSVKDDVHYLCFYNSTASKNCILKLANDVVTPVVVWSGLNFSPLKEHRINGGGLAGSLLFITDNYNQPRCIHTTRYTSTPPASEEEILVIKRGPQLAPTFIKSILGPEVASYTVESKTSTSVTIDGTLSTLVANAGYFIVNNQVYEYDGKTTDTFNNVTPDADDVSAGNKLSYRKLATPSIINNFNFQFAFYYQYEDNQLSVLSPYSKLCASSVVDEDWRSVIITIPDQETIPAMVKEIVLVARIDNTGKFFEIGRIKKESGVFVENTFTFLNNTNGNLVDPFLENPFSLVPRKSGSLALSKSRLWLGNNLEGYNTPAGSDIKFSLTSGTRYKIYQQRYTTYQYVGGEWEVQITGLTTYFGDYNYYIKGISSKAVFVDFDDVGFDVNVPVNDVGRATLLESESQPSSPSEGTTYTVYIEELFTNISYPDGVEMLVESGGSPLAYSNGQRTFPLDSSYKGGILFSDANGRKCGVYTDDSMLIDTPADLSERIDINWFIDSDDYIPSWAEYYSVVLTKNLKKSFYFEHYSIDLYYSKSTASGTDFKFYGSGSKKTYPYVKINVKHLPLSGLAYVFMEGDRVTLRQVGVSGSEADFDLEVVGFDGTTITCKRGQMEVQLSTNGFGKFELYRPIRTGGAGMLFYEMATHKIITDPITGAKGYSVLSGVFEGDSLITKRDIYEVVSSEVSDSGNDDYFRTIALSGGVWNTDIGRPFVQTIVGEVQKSAYVRHSGTFIAGTELNALSDFAVAEEGNIPIESGSITKLQPTQKESTEGDVLLALSESETFSIYIDEARVTQGTSSFLIGANKVIGDVRKQKSGYGTLHPESVHEEDGYVYFFDKLSRSFVRYATNGIFPLSEYKMVTHFEDQSALNDQDDEVVTGYDPFYKMIFVTFKNSSSNVRKTVGYSIPKERWISFYDFAPEGYVTGSSALYSIKSGVLYKHSNQTNFNRFYGVDYNGVVEYSFNEAPDDLKEWKSIELGVSPNLYSFSGGEQLIISNGLSADISNRHGQSTNILYDEFDVNENMVHGEIRGDLNTGGVLTGDPIFSNTILCRVSMLYGANKYLLYAKAGFETSRGHDS